MVAQLSTLLELRRRKVFRGVGYYLVGAWTLLQIAEVVAEPAGLPAWTLTALLYLSVLAFPLAVWLGWRYEFTDRGLVRTRPASGAESADDFELRWSDYVIFAAMVAVIGAVAWQGLGAIRGEAEHTGAAEEQVAEAERKALENSVAVLPFSMLGGTEKDAFLGDGIADTVLHVLSQVDGLKVTARTSSFAFHERGMTLEEIAGELGVAHVLEGSVQRAGDQMRVIARLVDARSGRELWSGNFDRGVVEVFAVQDEIAREAAVALRGVVLEDDREGPDEYRPRLDAYEQYVLAMRDLDQGSTDSLADAVRRLEKAIAIDSGYALAYTSLARALSARAAVSESMEFPELRQRQETLVEQALDLDPTLAEAWNLKARLLGQEKRFEEAAAAQQRALELNPNSAEAWNGQRNLLIFTGDRESALAAARKAAELDPESSRYQGALAAQLFDMGRGEEAIYVLRQDIRRHPEAPGGYQRLAIYLEQFGRPGEAMWYVQTALRRDPENLSLRAQVCMLYFHLWRTEEALDCQRDLVERAPGRLEARMWLAWMTSDMEAAARIAREKIEQMPEAWYPKMQLSDALAFLGRFDEIVALVPRAFPELVRNEPVINDFNQWGARRLAEALIRTGEVERGRALATRTLEYIERSRKLQAGGWIAGVEDALLLAVLGENDRALSRLDAAVRDGWTFYARNVVGEPVEPALGLVRDDPRFPRIVANLRAHLAEEWMWYLAHKDELELPG